MKGGSHVSAPNPTAILAALHLPAPDAVEPATGGADTLVWRVRAGRADFALRLLRAGQEGRCRREAGAMAAAASGGLPVPAVRAVGTWEDRPAMLMDWCAGHTLVDELLANHGSLCHMGRLFGETQAALHRIAPPPGLNTGWLDASGPEGGGIRARLAALPVRSNALVHFDYHPLNVLTDGERITGIIDWANASAGDPRADIARTLSILRLHYRQRGDISAAVSCFARAWRQGYAGACGLAVDEHLALFFAWSGLVMMQDQAGKQEQAFYRRTHAWAARWAKRGGCPL